MTEVDDDLCVLALGVLVKGLVHGSNYQLAVIILPSSLMPPKVKKVNNAFFLFSFLHENSKNINFFHSTTLADQ